jgi:2-amino-4-hydroxy-6-hydroxymethyldihydropteridine diphosphokinase
VRAFISIGSNLGDRKENLEKALEGMLTKTKTKTKTGPAVETIKKSSLYETRPWGRADQPLFINAAVEVETSFSPRELLGFLKRLEAEMGRPPSIGKDRWGPRVIDLDIVFYGDMVVREEGLTIPHPHAHERDFVMVPLEEIAPGFVHPVLGKRVSELARPFKEAGGCKRLPPGD